MKRFHSCRGSWVAATLAIFLLTMASSAMAKEDARKFLEALREVGYFDTALEYLEQARTNPLIDEAFKQTIDYEAGVTLIASARGERSTSASEKQLAEAKVLFDKFLTANPSHPLAPSGRTQLANLLAERGSIKLKMADNKNKSDAEIKAYREEARSLFKEAQKVFATLEKEFSEAHSKFPKFIPPEETAQIEARDQVRRDLLQARLALASATNELANTYDPDSEDNKKLLKEAADKYKVLYEKYGSRLAGLYARLWEGRCYRDLGDEKKAFECFEELLTLPDDPPAFRLLKNKTAVIALEAALQPKVAKYRQAIGLYEVWNKSARGPEEQSIEGLAIKFLAGQAALKYYEQLQKTDPDKARDNLNLARKLFKYVAKYPGEYQRESKAILAQEIFGGEDEGEPTTYVDARDRGKDALDRMQVAGQPEEEVAEARDEAIKYYRMALGMRKSDVPVEEVNVLRYYLTYLYWLRGDLYEAAVMGNFLSRKYSEATGARQAAKIAMAAYAKVLAGAEPNEDTTFENQQMVSIAEYIAGRWAGEPEADEAWMMLIRFAVVNGEAEKAMEYLKNVPEDSPRRGEADLMTGQAMWAAYLKASRLPEDERPSAEELDKMVAQTQTILEAGIQRLRKPVDEGTAQVNYTLVASVLSLAQICIGSGDAAKAVEWLDDPKIGAMTLVKANNSATQRGNFPRQTYMAALRAYVSVQQLDKAEEVMASLEKISPGAALTQTYIALGRQLEQNLIQLREQKKEEQLKKVAAGFELFLDKISQSKQGNTFASLNWVAETFFGMGAGFSPDGASLTPQAKKYYEKAAATYQKILDRIAANDTSFGAPAGADDSIKIRLATCQRRLGDYASAMKLLLGILKVRGTMVTAQVEAAYTYQAWGEEKPPYYELAIKGSSKYKEIWGWGKLAKRLARSPKHRSVFHEARYNLALCRMKLGATQKGAEKKETLERAERDIVIVQKLYPAMGGEEWYGKYDTLLKKIERLLGKNATGLKGLEKESASTKS